MKNESWLRCREQPFVFFALFLVFLRQKRAVPFAFPLLCPAAPLQKSRSLTRTSRLFPRAALESISGLDEQCGPFLEPCRGITRCHLSGPPDFRVRIRLGQAYTLCPSDFICYVAFMSPCNWLNQETRVDKQEKSVSSLCALARTWRQTIAPQWLSDGAITVIGEQCPLALTGTYLVSAYGVLRTLSVFLPVIFYACVKRALDCHFTLLMSQR